MLADRASPYLMEEPPTSTGRVLLSRALAHWCALHDGNSEEDIADALDPDGTSSDSDRRQIGFAARLLGELVAAGMMRASARPIGGGVPLPLHASVWERDDFRSIFARSALDLTRPFDEDAPPTHWIFLDVEDFDRVVQRSLGEYREPVAEPTAETPSQPVPASSPGIMRHGDHVRMPELERRTGMSRATIYRRIAERRFPESIPIDGNIAVWRESDIAEWLAEPR